MPVQQQHLPAALNQLVLLAVVPAVVLAAVPVDHLLEILVEKRALFCME